MGLRFFNMVWRYTEGPPRVGIAYVCSNVGSSASRLMHLKREVGPSSTSALLAVRGNKSRPCQINVLFLGMVLI